MTIDIILPSLLLLIAFLLKLSIDKTVELPHLLQAIFELPVDIMFLSLSFGIGYTISNDNHHAEGLEFLFCGLCACILVILIWKKTMIFFDKKKYKWLTFLVLINFLLSGLTIVHSVDLVKQSEKKSGIASINIIK